MPRHPPVPTRRTRTSTPKRPRLTDAQLAANRANAQESTGPRTAAGKARSSANAVSFGLFSARGFVRPEEAALWEDFRAGVLAELCPESLLEESFAQEILHGMWRLRRCALAEESLASAADPQESGQASVDRARAQAASTVRRATAELRRLQTERSLRPELGATKGLVSSDARVRILGADARRRLLARCVHSLGHFETMLHDADKKVAQAFQSLARTTAAKNPPTTKRTHSPGRNAPCPCGSRLKFKRCCASKHHLAKAPPPPTRDSKQTQHPANEISGIDDIPVWDQPTER
jgi:hypothetical protein